MLCSELYDLPMVPFILQPSAIPSRSKSWRAVEAISSTTCCERPFTSHTALSALKKATEIALPSIRRSFGLKHAPTWPTLKRLEAPVLMPFMPGTVDLPADFPPSFRLTDFIFLRTTHDQAGGAGGLPADVESFLVNAAEARRKVVLV